MSVRASGEPQPGSRREGGLPVQLDYGWWASNGPAGGYLTSLALEAAQRAPGLARAIPRGVDLHILRLAAADEFDTTVAVATGPTRLALATVTFCQGEPFAVASMYYSPARGSSLDLELRPPAALPPEAYPEMATNERSLPPVTSRFRYRPTTGPDGRGPRPGWDVVWVRPHGRRLTGRAEIATVLDCWYPPSHMHRVREYLRGARAVLNNPPPTNLMAVHALFPAPEAAYGQVSDVLLANFLSGSAEGHYFEHSEIWSEGGDLLVTALLLRRNEQPAP
jgi:hypothetical protein